MKRWRRSSTSATASRRRRSRWRVASRRRRHRCRLLQQRLRRTARVRHRKRPLSGTRDKPNETQQQQLRQPERRAQQRRSLRLRCRRASAAWRCPRSRSRSTARSSSRCSPSRCIPTTGEYVWSAVKSRMTGRLTGGCRGSRWYRTSDRLLPELQRPYLHVDGRFKVSSTRCSIGRRGAGLTGSDSRLSLRCCCLRW